MRASLEVVDRLLPSASTPRAIVPVSSTPEQMGGVVWLTGLSGAGKSTLAHACHGVLGAHGMRSTVLDGDVLRLGLNRDLGFSEQDRSENVRRVGEVAALFAQAGLIAIVALISPLAAMREQARAAGGERFREVYVKASVPTCEGRDPKGLYRKARQGSLPQFTGISAPYEAPTRAELVLDTEAHTVSECLEQLVAYVESQFVTGWNAQPLVRRQAGGMAPGA